MNVKEKVRDILIRRVKKTNAEKIAFVFCICYFNHKATFLTYSTIS